MTIKLRHPLKNSMSRQDTRQPDPRYLKDKPPVVNCRECSSPLSRYNNTDRCRLCDVAAETEQARINALRTKEVTHGEDMEHENPLPS